MHFLEIKLIPDPELQVVKAEVCSRGGHLFRPSYDVNFFNARNSIVDRFTHTFTDREWFNWGSSVYDEPYLKQIILKRYELKNGGIYLALAENDSIQTAVDPEDETILMIDEFNSYAATIDTFIAEEAAEMEAQMAEMNPSP